MAEFDGVNVGVFNWQPGDGVASQLAGALMRLGCCVTNLGYDTVLPQALDIVLAWGPLGTLCPLANQLLARPPAVRPAFVLLMTEQLPNPAWPEWLRYQLGRLRSRAERFAYRQQADGNWRVQPRWRWLTSYGHRLRYYGDLYWLRGQGLLSVLATTSELTATFLQARGFAPIVPGLRYDPMLGSDRNLDRDIPVLWLGQIATDRRGRLLARLRAELKTLGVEIYVVDGVEHPYVFGEQRTILLNRTKIVLNLLRTRWDDNSMRMTLAAHNGALIVSEPTLRHTPYRPGVHLVEAPIEQMANTICHYLTHEAERKRIAEQAFDLIQQYPFDQGVAQMVARALTPNKITQREP